MYTISLQMFHFSKAPSFVPFENSLRRYLFRLFPEENVSHCLLFSLPPLCLFLPAGSSVPIFPLPPYCCDNPFVVVSKMWTYICVLGRVLRRNRTNRIYILKWAFTRVIMEAEKSHDLPSGSWRTRRASGLVQSHPGGLRPREPMSRPERASVLAQAESTLALLHPAVPPRLLMALMTPTSR